MAALCGVSAVVHTGAMLLTFIAEVADEPLVLDPANPAVESRANTWALGADREERAKLSVQEVVAAFERTAEGLRHRISDLRFHGTVTFYVWYDEQAGQLRCSTSSRPPASLPFGGAYVLTEALELIIMRFLDDSDPGTVPWTGMAESGFDGQDLGDVSSVPQPLPVWTRGVGGECS